MPWGISSTYDVSEQPPIVVQSVQEQARRYAVQIRGLEQRGFTDDVPRVRRAWQTFINQHTNSDLWWFARSEYADAYLNTQI